MTDTIVHLTGAALRDARRALDELLDSVLRDMGLARTELPFVAVGLTPRSHERLGPAVATHGGLLPGFAGIALAAMSKIGSLWLGRRSRAGQRRPVGRAELAFAKPAKPARRLPPKDTRWV